jgi:cathepsin F
MAKEGTMSYSSLTDDEQQDLFEYYKKSFGKQYDSTDEEEQRFQHFKNFLSVVDQRNTQERAAGGSAIHGVTIFSDLSEEEFKTNLLGYKAPSVSSSAAIEAEVTPYTGSTTSVNWAGIYTTAVKNQGYCGSCWAFSTASQIESDAIRTGLLTTDTSLSAQQIVSWYVQFS